jgi:hypothetical protein
LLRLREVAEDVFRSEQLTMTGPKTPWERIIRLNILLEALTYLGRLEEGGRIAEKLEPLAKKVANPFAVALVIGKEHGANLAVSLISRNLKLTYKRHRNPSIFSILHIGSFSRTCS